MVVVGVAAYSEGKRERAAIAAVAGLGLLQNALTGFCGGNLLFGLDTTADGGDACSLE
ncbi:YgaP-like transmembrane domain [Natronorubrum sp. DTA28]|uniref:YgaP-like transmembrane domain n=1 Tax=Natronorubrum sp. DTA28 TaxID=3447019 RepID=UPI003F8421C0